MSVKSKRAAAAKVQPVEQVAPVEQVPEPIPKVEKSPKEPVDLTVSAHARIRTLINDDYINKLVIDKIKKLKDSDEWKKLVAVPSDKQTAAQKEKLQTLSAEKSLLSVAKTRFSAPIYAGIAMLFDRIFIDIFTHAAHQKVKASNLTLQDVFAAGCEKLPLYNLLDSLPIWRKAQVEQLKLQQESALAAAAEKAKKELAKYLLKSLSKEAKDEVNKLLKAEEQSQQNGTEQRGLESDELQPGPEQKFTFYINKMSKIAKNKNPDLANVRISKELREFFDALFCELCNVLTNLLLTIKEVKKLKTIDVSYLYAVLKFLLVGNSTYNAELVELTHEDKEGNTSRELVVEYTLAGDIYNEVAADIKKVVDESAEAKKSRKADKAE